MLRIPNLSLVKEQVGHTGLMQAALAGETRRVEALLDNGTDVNARDHEGRTALMFASINSHSTIVRMLLKHNADVNVRANDGGTALMLATCSDAEEIVQMLLEKGADVKARFTATNRTALVIAREHCYLKLRDLLEKSGVDGSRSARELRGTSQDISLSITLSRASAAGGGGD